ncbi:MAG: TOBE domain-containing protein [Halobacteriales archaeon]
MDASVDAQLRAGGVAFTAADASLLRAVDEAGSVSGAAEALERSRARALDRIETLEEAFGSLVERRRGGATGGGSDLTDRARDLLAQFDRLRATLAGTATVEERVLPGTVRERDGELGVVETAAGAVRARLVALPDRDPPTVGDAVQVGVRSDAVTLQSPADSPPADATSARNRFEGEVTGVDRRTAIARVAVAVGGPDPLVATLTHESLDRLALAAGSPVVVTFKATATRAIAAE